MKSKITHTSLFAGLTALSFPHLLPEQNDHKDDLVMFGKQVSKKRALAFLGRLLGQNVEDH